MCYDSWTVVPAQIQTCLYHQNNNQNKNNFQWISVLTSPCSQTLCELSPRPHLAASGEVYLAQDCSNSSALAMKLL